MKNPLQLFKKKKQILFGGIYDNFIYANDHVDIVHDACKICYNKEKEETRKDKLDYIQRRVKTGHESILEHSNVILYIVTQKNETSLQSINEVTDLCKYLNIKTKPIKNELHTLIGGSIRGYKHIFRNIKNQDNIIAKTILNDMYRTNKEYFNDFIEDNIMSESKFVDLEDYTYPALATKKVLSKNIEILNMDNIEYVHKELNGIFTYDELLDFVTATVFFKDISRIISQQVTRHRNGITQLSQRYVDYSSGEFGFNSPALFKDKYDKNYKYDIIFDGQAHKLTLEELGQRMMAIYNQLVDKSLGEHSLVPEDARAYLPNNAQTSLYMTFTFRTLIKFLQLRTDPHAQAEIRIMATAIESFIRPVLESIIKHNMYDSLLPLYKNDIIEDVDPYAEIDEPVK